MPTASLDGPFGRIAVTEQAGAITRIAWVGEAYSDETLLLDEARCQLRAYFAGDLHAFDLPLRVGGSDFQRAVCAAMRAIPYGQTRTYGEIAHDLGTFGQPVGAACAANPIPIVIPCHRVLSVEGLGGFSGGEGIETKIALLRHEDSYPFLI